MMAPYPAPMAGWSAIVPTVVDCVVRGAGAEAMPDKVPAGHHGLLGGTVVFFGLHPKTRRRFVVQSMKAAAGAGVRTRTASQAPVSVCEGDVRNGSIGAIELKVSGADREARASARTAGRAPANIVAVSGLDVVVRNLVEGRWNFDKHPPQPVPAVGSAPWRAGRGVQRATW